MSRLAGKVALITGAGSGQGRAVAVAYAAEGASVACCDIDGDAAQDTAERCQGGGRAIGVSTDVSDAAAAAASVARTEAELGRLDVLYNNAGINPGAGADGGVTDLDLEIWDRVLAVDLTGVMLMCRAAIPAMRATGGGSIVNVSSVSASLGGAGNAYTAAKGGALALTKAIATSYAPDIRCNAICPGAIDTPMIEVTLADPAVRRRWESRTLVGRIGVPEDIAPLAVYLGSDESAFVTGATFIVDGGHSAH